VTIRTTKKTITFTKPFTLKGVDEVLPPGVYSVETDERLIESLSFPAYRRISTLLYVPGKPGEPVVKRTVTIDPKELEAALERDGTRKATPAGPDAHQETLTKAVKSRLELADRQAVERGEDEGMMVHLG
jgi:hypothetical protein